MRALLAVLVSTIAAPALAEAVTQVDTELVKGRVLAVIRMEARRACLMAVSDEASNQNSRSLAHATADAQAPNFSCAKGQPKVVGAPSYWAQAVIGFDGDPPP